MELINGIDAAILLFVQENLRCPVLDVIMKAASTVGNAGLGWIALGLVLLIFRRTRVGGEQMLAALAAEYCLCDLVLKPLFNRTRPYLVLDWLVLLVEQETTASFPSGHAASGFACALMLTRAFGKCGALSYIPAALIALSRIYVGVHYPSDVLAGMLLGTAVGAAASLIIGLVARGKARKK